MVPQPRESVVIGDQDASESVEAVIKMIVEVWDADGLDVHNAKYADLLETIEITPVPMIWFPTCSKTSRFYLGTGNFW